MLLLLYNVFLSIERLTCVDNNQATWDSVRHPQALVNVFVPWR